MKKNLLIVLSLIFITTTIFLFSGCKKDKITTPAIVLNGDNPMSVILKGAFTEPGFTANDDTDGDITSSVTVEGDVNTDTANAYIITYTVTNSGGVTVEEKRTVNVVNKSASREGDYNVHDIITGPSNGIYNYIATITASTTKNDTLYISNFASFSYNCSVEIAFDNIGNISIPEQTLSGVPVGSEGTISGSGTTEDDGTTLNITYIINYYAGGTDNGNATYTKN